VRRSRWRTRAERAGDRWQARAEHQPWLGLPLALAARYTGRQGALLAGATAFRLFLWLLPLVLLGSAVLAALVDDIAEQVDDAGRAAGLTGPLRQQVLSALEEGERSWWLAAGTGGLLLTWTTWTLHRTLTLVSAHIWALPLRRSSRKHRLADACAVGLALVVALAATAVAGNLRVFGLAGRFLAVGLGIAVVTAAWFAVSLRLPRGRSTLADLAPGCVLVGVGFVALSAASRLYLPARFAGSSELYGSLGLATVALAWLLIIGQLIVTATFVNVVWTDHRSNRRSVQ
jgi:uncharacterized BrkB/YihY/UPF0761 family membrane protein